MKQYVIGLAAVLVAATGAVAADFPGPAEPPFMPMPEVTVGEASGWYLRGDASYSFNKLRGARYYQGGPGGYQADFGTTRQSDSYTAGAGVGYQFNNYLRSDLTFDYLGKTDFRGSTFGGCGVNPAGPCVSTDRSALRAYSLMANAYVDLGTYGAITPYAGAGIGGSYVKWDKLRNVSCDMNGAGCDPLTEHGGKGQWRLTYALMAGASIDLTCNLKADIGYRFRHIAGGDMFGYANNGGPGRDKGINSHEIRVGGRYMFGGCETVQYLPPVEIPLQPAVYK